jgi:Zn-dependent M28 family amino/carboxypeptidase
MRVSTANLEKHVRRLASDIGERNVFRVEALAAAAAYIENTWAGQGYQVQHQRYVAMDVECANLEITLPGTDRDAGILLLGAHYDSVRSSPGANDNASGVAALLELSRVFADRATAMTVRFVAFVNEEPPFFMKRQQGSMVYARAARAVGDDIRLMVSLETIGYYCDAPGSQRYPPPFGFFYPNRGDFIGFVSNFSSRKLMRQAVRSFRVASDFPLQHVATLGLVPGVSWSDHRSFWRCGYRANMVTDTALYRYPYYHTANDTPDKLAYPAFARVTDGLFRCFAEIARTGTEDHRA